MSLFFLAPRHERASPTVVPFNVVSSCAAGALLPRRVVAFRSSVRGVSGVLFLQLAGASASAFLGFLADCGAAVMRQDRANLTQVQS